MSRHWEQRIVEESGEKISVYGGVLMDVETNQVIVQGLSMPHSPRWYQNRLWVLESGNGSLATVDLASGKSETVTQLPGFTRGIDFWGV